MLNIQYELVLLLAWIVAVYTVTRLLGSPFLYEIVCKDRWNTKLRAINSALVMALSIIGGGLILFLCLRLVANWLEYQSLLSGRLKTGLRAAPAMVYARAHECTDALPQ